MLSSLSKTVCACWFVAWLTCMTAGAASFSLTPESIATGNTNTLVLSVGGLANTQQILVEEFRDANGNGLGYGRKSITIDASGGSVTGVQLSLSRAMGSLQLVFFFPSGSFGSGTNGNLTQVRWSCRDINGSPISTPPFLESLDPGASPSSTTNGRKPTRNGSPLCRRTRLRSRKRPQLPSED